MALGVTVDFNANLNQLPNQMNGVGDQFIKMQKQAEVSAAAITQSLSKINFDKFTANATNIKPPPVDKLMAALSQSLSAGEIKMQTGFAAASRQTQAAMQQMEEKAKATSSNMTDSFAKVPAAMKGFAAAFVGVEVFKGLAGDILQTNMQMETLRMQLTAVMGSAAAGKDSFDFIKRFAIDTPFEVETLTKAFLTLRNFGIEPTSQVMNAVTNEASKLGGSAETLTGITLALGQAWAKGKLQGQEILQLVNQGVPVWDLLSQATGKNVQQLQAMSEKGELTQETIKQLIETMGEMAKGSNDLAMDTLRGKISNLSDAWHNWEDTLLGDKSEGVIKSIVAGATSALEHMTQGMSTNIDDMLANAKNMEKMYGDGNANSAIAKRIKYFEALKAQQEEDQAAAAELRKVDDQKKKSAEDETKRLQAAAAEHDAYTEILVENANKAYDAREAAAKKSQALAQQTAKAYQAERDSVRAIIEQLQFEVSISDQDAEAKKKLTEIRSATAHATDSERAQIQKLIQQKYDLAEADQTITDGEKLAAKQRADSLSDYDRLNQKFNGKQLDLNAGINDAVNARALGIIPNDAALKSALDKMGRDFNGLKEDVNADSKDMSVYAEQSARNMQTAFAQFLFDPFNNGAQNMVSAFAKATAQMVANAASAKVMESLFGNMSSKTGGGELGGLFGMLFGSGGGSTASAGGFGGTYTAEQSLIEAGVLHGGGTAGSGSRSMSVDPVLFAGAKRYHSGGVVGLQTGEVPAILQTGERVLSREQAASGIGHNISTTVNVNGASNTDPKSAAALGDRINAQVRQIIAQEQRPGGLLA